MREWFEDIDAEDVKPTVLAGLSVFAVVLKKAISLDKR
jgi:hypothetical protein